MRRATTVAAFAWLLVTYGCATPPVPAFPSPSVRGTTLATSIAASSPDQPLANGRVARAAAMTVPRAVHTATRLVDGRILVAGGCTTNGCDLGSPDGATAELFDPERGTFSRTGALTVSRDDHAAARLPDGRVMLIGGWAASGVLANTDVYDPKTGVFRPGPTMRAARAGTVAVELDDGRLLIAGGFIGNRPTIASAELYDPVADLTTRTGDMATARGAHAAVRLKDGRVLIVGGLSGGVVTATAELYDPATGAFAATGPMRTARYKCGAALLPDGTVLVFGGSGDIDGTILYASTEIYDPVTGAFSAGPPMRSPRYKLPEASVLLDGGDILVAGGAPRPEIFHVASRSFDPVQGSLDATRLLPVSGGDRRPPSPPHGRLRPCHQTDRRDLAVRRSMSGTLAWRSRKIARPIGRRQWVELIAWRYPPALRIATTSPSSTGGIG